MIILNLAIDNRQQFDILLKSIQDKSTPFQLSMFLKQCEKQKMLFTESQTPFHAHYMKNSKDESSCFDDDELPIQYYMLFYYIPKQKISLYNNRALLSDVNLNLVKEAPIQFDLQPCISKCYFAQKKYFLKDDNLLDCPQLYKVFTLGDDYYTQVLDYIVKITVQKDLQKNFENVEKKIQITPCFKFMEREIEIAELTYGRVAKLSDKKLIYTVSGKLYDYEIENKVKNELKLKNSDEKKHDYMVFSYNGVVLVFDTLTNYVCELSQKERTYELIFLFETEGQLVLFQNKYLILSDGEQPKPLIEIVDIQNRKLYSCSQNWFQDNFWSWLKVRNGEIEVDEEVESIVKRLINGEKVGFSLDQHDREAE